MFRSVLRAPVLASTKIQISSRALGLTALRFNSSKSPIHPESENQTESLLDALEPSETLEAKPASVDPEEVANEWISAIQQLRSQIKKDGFEEPESGPHSKYYEKYKFEPTPEQIKQAEDLAEKPIPLKHDPVLEHCTNMIMKDGKKARAQRVMGRALYIVRLQLRKDPVEVLKEVLEKMSPLMAIRTQKSRAAKAIVMPVPLTQRQRHRTAFLWILDGAAKRRSADFEVRLGEELVAAYQGKSSGYDKRLQIHKTAMLQRAYVKLK